MYQVSSKAAASSSVALAAAKNTPPKESPPPAPSAVKNPPPKASAFVNQWHNAPNYFRIPVHYPRYTRAQYEAMDEARLDVLLQEYGLSIRGDLAQKRSDAIGHFIWRSKRSEVSRHLIWFRAPKPEICAYRSRQLIFPTGD